MSQENMALVRSAFEAAERDQPQNILDAEVEWDFSAYAGLDMPAQGTGAEDLRRLMERYRRAWLDYHMELKELVDAGPDVVVVVHETARMKQTELLIERDLAQVWTLEDGRVTRLRMFRTKQEALEAVGLPSELPSQGDIDDTERAFEAELRETDSYRRRIF